VPIRSRLGGEPADRIDQAMNTLEPLSDRMALIRLDVERLGISAETVGLIVCNQLADAKAKRTRSRAEGDKAQ
jgi:hypothetical protein